MPSLSRATSRINRFLADCEISMSDFGLRCCEAVIGCLAAVAWVGVMKASFQW